MVEKLNGRPDATLDNVGVVRAIEGFVRGLLYTAEQPHDLLTTFSL